MMSLEEKKNFFLISPPEKGIINYANIFGNYHELSLEIGSGKGEFLALVSQKFPEKNFLGVELKKKRIITILKKLDPKKNKNVRLLNLRVDSMITNYLPSACLNELIIYHPDPWPKKRHHKHRLFQPNFLEACSQLLKDKGLIKISTDHAEYAQWITNLFSQRDDLLSLLPDQYCLTPPVDHFPTFFDQLQKEKGFDTWFMIYHKIMKEKKE